MDFIDQASPDIKRKLQKMEGLQDKTLRELVQAAEKMYHNRETEEEKEESRKKEEEKELKKERCQNQNLQKILATVVQESKGGV